MSTKNDLGWAGSAYGTTTLHPMIRQLYFTLDLLGDMMSEIDKRIKQGAFGFFRSNGVPLTVQSMTRNSAKGFFDGNTIYFGYRVEGRFVGPYLSLDLVPDKGTRGYGYHVTTYRVVCEEIVTESTFATPIGLADRLADFLNSDGFVLTILTYNS